MWKESVAKLYILSSVILHLRTELKVLQSLYNTIKNEKIDNIGNDVLRDRKSMFIVTDIIK